MSQLDEDIRAADALGISYGYYIARTYDPYKDMTAPPVKKRKRRRFSDAEAFALWQDGKNDSEIGRSLGVTQQTISNWRNQLELPLLSKNMVNPQKYRLAELPDGTCIAVHIDEF